MQLTEHFSDTELGVTGCDARLVVNATYLCSELLEPIRNQFGPVLVHDGYRDPGHNARVGGKTASFHLFEDGRAAADISVPDVRCEAVFDWIRLESGLPFDKVILETSPVTHRAATVHLQIDMKHMSRRQAFTGWTGASEDYTPAGVR